MIFVNFDSSPALYSDVDINIFTTEDVSHVNLIMVSKGMIVKSTKLTIENRQGSLTFTPKFSYAPRTYIIAYYVQRNGEIISDSTSLSFQNRLPNFVSIYLNIRKLEISLFLR